LLCDLFSGKAVDRHPADSSPVGLSVDGWAGLSDQVAGRKCGQGLGGGTGVTQQKALKRRPADNNSDPRAFFLSNKFGFEHSFAQQSLMLLPSLVILGVVQAVFGKTQLYVRRVDPQYFHAS
jgi:hypothetical protein